MYVFKSQFHTVLGVSQYPFQHLHDGDPAKGVRYPCRISAVTCTSWVDVGMLLLLVLVRGGMARFSISCGVEQWWIVCISSVFIIVIIIIRIIVVSSHDEDITSTSSTAWCNGLI